MRCSICTRVFPDGTGQRVVALKDLRCFDPVPPRGTVFETVCPQCVGTVQRYLQQVQQKLDTTR